MKCVMDLEFSDCEKLRACLDRRRRRRRRRRQRQCRKEQKVVLQLLQGRPNSTAMAACCCCYNNIYSFFVVFLFLVSSFCPVLSLNFNDSNHQFFPGNGIQNLKLVRAHVKKINKPSVKSIQSPDGDIIDCILFHKQPAFDHPQFKGQKPSYPPDRPKGRRRKSNTGVFRQNFQLWNTAEESCPDGTIPVRRTTEKDVLRASSIQSFGKKIKKPTVRDSSSNGHEHAVGYVSGNEYYGAKASINVWAPRVDNPYEFSLSQMWVIAGSFGDDLNTIEAGWQVSPELYGDNYPRFFTYWTSDAYQATGCYNLLCSGFVQTNNKIAIGAAISPTSAYNGGQFDISLLIWKVGSQAWQLVAGIWEWNLGRVLAIVLVQPFEGSCKHGSIWWGDSEQPE
ncbi:uncharacterized protein LOC127261622 isoform X2 [Andrographis paniculata]|uniref:uncharacterized protein LOC127261622 isoform X2 n=1 Tax=Andrographis paniculata TaxID=175694 RepID=UPI0021E75B07|nr:uncharacterized protein LOC127261622 isoform X2 [Andrographis paniculata]